MSEVPSFNPDIQKDVPKKLSEQLVDMFREAGRDAQIVKFEGTELFKGAIVFPHRKKFNEPTVRIYRGVARLDKSLLRQEPYAIRTRPDKNKEDIEFLEHAREVMEALAEHPTAQKLYDYVDTVWPDLTDEEIRRFDTSLRELEDSVMDHHITLRWALMFEQYKFGSGPWADTGIPPYIPATLDPKQAVSYGGSGGVFVIDVPLSAVEWHNDSGEVNIKGALKAEHITAILPREIIYEGRIDPLSDFTKAKAQLEQIAPVMFDRTKESELIKKTIRETRESDEKQWEQDVAVIRARRSKIARQRFADTGVQQEMISKIVDEDKVDEYTATKRGIFDALVEQHDQTYDGKYGRDYLEENGFDRESIDEENLDRLRKLVRNRQEYTRHRMQYERERNRIQETHV